MHGFGGEMVNGNITIDSNWVPEKLDITQDVVDVRFV
jgi:hypothetical protein